MRVRGLVVSCMLAAALVGAGCGGDDESSDDSKPEGTEASATDSSADAGASGTTPEDEGDDEPTVVWTVLAPELGLYSNGPDVALPVGPADAPSPMGTLPPSLQSELLGIVEGGIDGDLLMTSVDDEVRRIDSETGETEWSVRPGAGALTALGEPRVLGGVIVTDVGKAQSEPMGMGNFYDHAWVGLDASGAELWRTEVPSSSSDPVAMTDDVIVVEVGGADPDPTADGAWLALGVADGAERWRVEPAAGQCGVQQAGGQLLRALADSIEVYDLATGALAKTIPGNYCGGDTPFEAAGSGAVAMVTDGKLAVIDLESGAVTDLGALEDEVGTNVAIGGGYVAVTTAAGTSVYSLADGGALAWEQDTPQATPQFYTRGDELLLAVGGLQYDASTGSFSTGDTSWYAVEDGSLVDGFGEVQAVTPDGDPIVVEGTTVKAVAWPSGDEVWSRDVSEWTGSAGANLIALSDGTLAAGGQNGGVFLG